MTQPQPSLTDLYQQLNLKISGETLPAYRDKHVIGEPKTLGSGTYNTVYAVQLERSDGMRFDGVFKPLRSTETGGVAEATGIPVHDPQIAMRNLATVDYAKALGFDVVPETKLAHITTDPHVGAQLGLMMDRAKGRSGYDTPPDILAMPEVARETMKLQLLDHLTGQGDRHGDNYFIHVKPDGSVKVTGIDNDQCFGAAMTDPGGAVMTDHPKCPFRGVALPPVVDPEMARAIQNLTPNDVVQMLGGKLSGPEVDAAIQRLGGVQQHIAHLQSQGLVLDVHLWPQVNHLMNMHNCYGARENYYNTNQQW